MRTAKLAITAVLLFISLALASSGCSLEDLKDAATGEPRTPEVSIHTITYNWMLKTASVLGEFTSSGRVNGVRIVVGEKVGDDVVPWFDDVYYIRQDVSAGDPLMCESYDVKPPTQQTFDWKAVVTDVF